MKTLRNIKIPTGNILIVEGDKGKLEMLSLGDYGKAVNIKCDAMGLTRELDKVEHTNLLPLSEKWVVTISSQYGCSMGCKFCDVPKVGKGINATANDMVEQVRTGIALHPEVKSTKRLNIHFARMGEPTFNPDVILAAKMMKEEFDDTYKLHPVVSTMMPNNNHNLKEFITRWMWLKNEIFMGEAGLQLSINSTNEAERISQFGGSACSLEEIRDIMAYADKPLGRKITLNFAVAGYEIDASKLVKYFDPKDYIIKLTPMHKTHAALKNKIQTEGDYTTYYPYKEHEKQLKWAGYDVLVFIASWEEDASRITCGNAILSGTMPFSEYEEIK